jgi:hypothetical protein
VEGGGEVEAKLDGLEDDTDVCVKMMYGVKLVLLQE